MRTRTHRLSRALGWAGLAGSLWACGGKSVVRERDSDDEERGGATGSAGTVTGASGGTGASAAGGTGATGATGGVRGKASDACVPGSARSCIGPNACTGVEVCNDNGTGWRDCFCSSSGNGDGGLPSCDPQLRQAFCRLTTENCPDDTTPYETCVAAGCAEPNPFIACLPELEALERCALAGTVVCDQDGLGRVTNVDCRAEGEAYTACMNWRWRCEMLEPGATCSCERYGTGGNGVTCPSLPCCFMDWNGSSCTCISEAACNNLAEGLIPVNGCPYP